MTRDEQRKACIEAIKTAILASIPDTWEPMVEEAAVGALDSLHGIANVCPIVATERMVTDGELAAGSKWAGHPVVYIFTAMSVAGDLTNPPSEVVP